MSHKVQCNNCKFALEKTAMQGGGLECRRNPPHVLAIVAGNQAQIISVQPTVTADFHCGEFQNSQPLKLVS